MPILFVYISSSSVRVTPHPPYRHSEWNGCPLCHSERSEESPLLSLRSTCYSQVIASRQARQSLLLSLRAKRGNLFLYCLLLWEKGDRLRWMRSLHTPHTFYTSSVFADANPPSPTGEGFLTTLRRCRLCHNANNCPR